jgi:hypothetical protein
VLRRAIIISQHASIGVFDLRNGFDHAWSFALDHTIASLPSFPALFRNIFILIEERSRKMVLK